MKLNPPEEHIKLSACPHCGRTFNASAYEKHVNVCENVTKKRRVFDSSRQRRVGNEYAPPSPINVKELKAKLDAVTNDVKIAALDNNTSAPEKTIIAKVYHIPYAVYRSIFFTFLSRLSIDFRRSRKNQLL